MYVYLLKLEKGKWFIGMEDPCCSYKDHTGNPYTIDTNDIRWLKYNFSGNNWTIKYKPLKVQKIFYYCDKTDEYRITRHYMKIYGIDNVRGSYFKSLKLSDSTINELSNMKPTNKSFTCLRCGREGHHAYQCNKSTHINNAKLSRLD
tara:strand:+ start:7177 stop:7617 length:441 start_codon:yes stop_codon:yes gene_type:complete